MLVSCNLFKIFIVSAYKTILEQRKLETDNFAHEIARFGEEMNNRPKIREKTFYCKQAENETCPHKKEEFSFEDVEF